MAESPGGHFVSRGGSEGYFLNAAFCCVCSVPAFCLSSQKPLYQMDEEQIKAKKGAFSALLRIDFKRKIKS